MCKIYMYMQSVNNDEQHYESLGQWHPEFKAQAQSGHQQSLKQKLLVENP